MPVSTIFLPWSPLNNPVYSVLITALVMLILVPAIISVIIGTIFKSNIAFVAVAVYAAIIILAFLVTLIYALMSIIKWLMKNGR
jgi:hypothetical protein